MPRTTALSLAARWLGAGVLALLAGCGSAPAAPAAALPTPTVSTMFGAVELPPSPTPRPSATPRPTSAAARTPAPSQASLVELPIFDETLAAGWTLDRSWAMRFNPRSAQYVQRGEVALAVTPTDDWGGLFFTVSRDAKRAYERPDVAGVSFWINAGTNFIAGDDLVVTMNGSNELPYVVPSEDEAQGRVQPDKEPLFFSETQLYFLGVNDRIPANTWVEITLWFDEREFDSDYKYVTGFYIKNTPEYKQTFYIDNVRLLTFAPSP